MLIEGVSVLDTNILSLPDWSMIGTASSMTSLGFSVDQLTSADKVVVVLLLLLTSTSIVLSKIDSEVPAGGDSVVKGNAGDEDKFGVVVDSTIFLLVKVEEGVAE